MAVPGEVVGMKMVHDRFGRYTINHGKIVEVNNCNDQYLRQIVFNDCALKNIQMCLLPTWKNDYVINDCGCTSKDAIAIF